MSFKHPNSVLIRVGYPPVSAVALMNQLKNKGCTTGIRCIQQWKKYEWCVTFTSQTYVEMAERVFQEYANRDFIVVKLKANGAEKCTLERVLKEVSNININARLE